MSNRNGGDEQWTFGLVDDDGPPEPPSVDPVRREQLEALRRADASPLAGLRCPDCGYDLSGTRRGVCPECGLKLTNAAIRRAHQKQNKKLSDSPMFEASVWLGAGLLAGGVAYSIGGGMEYAASGGSAAVGAALGLLAFLIYLVVNVVVGWCVFFAASAMWIGWAQTVPVTIVQLAGAYTAATAISGLVGLFLPGLLAWLISVGCLIGLLCRLLDLEARDAVLIAFVTWAIKFLVVLAVVGGLGASLYSG